MNFSRFEQLIRGASEERSNKDADPEKLMVELVLALQRPELQTALFAAAVPHWFNEAILADLLPDNLKANAAGFFDELRKLPFVEKFYGRGSVNVHAKLRRALLRYLAVNDQPRLREISRAAAAAFEKISSSEAVIERAYHLLTGDPSAGLENLRRLRRHFTGTGQIEAKTALARSISELADVPHQPKRILAEALIARVHAHLQAKSPEDATQTLGEVIELLKDEGDQQRRAEVTNYLARLSSAAGRYREALTLADKARDLVRGLGAHSENEHRELLSLTAQTHHIQGQAFLELERYREASTEFEKDIALSRYVLLSDPDEFGACRRELAVAYQNLAVALLAQPERLGEVEKVLNEELQITRGLAEQFSDNLEYRHDLSISLGSFGDYWRKVENYEKARELYTEGVEIMKGLLQVLPEHSPWKHSSVASRQRLAAAYRKLNRNTEAIQTLRDTLQPAKELVELDPTKVEWVRNLSVSHNLLAEALLQKGEITEALAHAREDLRLARDLQQRNPDSRRSVDDLKESEELVAHLEGRSAEGD